MSAGARTSPLTDLARRGFGDLSAAAAAIDELGAALGLERETLLAPAGAAADADAALGGLVRVARRNADAVRRVLADEHTATTVWRLFGASTALADFYLRHPDELDDLTDAGEELPTADQLRATLLDSVGAHGGFAASGEEADWVALRVRYRRMIARIAAYDLAASAAVDVLPDVAAALADAAAAAIDASLAVARTRVSGGTRGVGLFTRDEVARTRIAVIGMGKAGARELNYVSDVDVIFVAASADEATVSEARAVDVATRLAVQLMRGISEVEVEPPLWEVDPNLRPEGKQGALVRTLDSHLTYYDRWAHSWEFQALLKARAMAGDIELGDAYVAGVQPKVWSSAARTNFVDSVQRMRERVTDNIPAADVPFQLKLGPGGLRDIEFTVQLLQLVHGLADDTIRARGTLEALDELVVAGYIGRSDAAAFSLTYRTLRVMEHRLQLAQLRRTHLMPRDDDGMRRLARATGLAETGPELADLWERVKRQVREIHVKLFYRPLLSAVATLPEDGRSLSAAQAHERLAAIGFADPAGALGHVAALTSGISRRAAIQRHLMPVLLQWFSEGVDPDYGLLAYRRIGEKLGDTSWFLRLLRDSTAAAEHLTHILSASRYVADLIEMLPESVAWLDQAEQLVPRSGVALQDEARAIQDRHVTVDGAMRAVRALRRRELLRIAMASMLDLLTREEQSIALTTVTEVAIQATLRAVRREVVPAEDDSLDFAVIAMGRFGGAELGFGSDADVMFVYEANDVAPERAQELALRLVSDLRKHSEDHRLPLELDADLRPEGRNGPMARSLGAYAEYYERWSQPWEAQALLRARGIAGSLKLIRRFTDLADRVRYPETPDIVAVREIKRIKARVENERLPQGVDSRRHLKLGPGSLSDVEWLVQLWQFQHAARVPDLQTTSTISALRAAVAAGIASDAQAVRLEEAWELASRLRTANTLLTGRTSDVLPVDRRQLDGIARLIGYQAGSATAVEESYLAATRRARRVFEKAFYG